ncbi:ubiquinone biosynthesis protein UbiB [Lysobacter sp. A6]|uniref:Ubiquinone biosynthesis protein UbiB n=1 Tax=Noviluteimonas lactosilytica TaxID=2888523 RepID=A0ABS8JM24_9GAMM|nr:AarF/UbiB family protein [Lysobacter lactosilyticus]MCC8364675.1 ubiquinone biosynthesis protein UbiB [Lysobacter lactosilyticus]
MCAPSTSGTTLAAPRRESVFLSLDPVPLAAASIAQVHRACLADGREVVVKVRRPGIGPLIESDLRLLQFAARHMELRFPQLRRFHPASVVRQFKASVTRELDLAAECRHAERISANFLDDPRLYVPEVHWAYTSERMNVQDFVDGIPAGDLAALDAAGIDRPRIARSGAQLVLRMLLRDGFFHADPHAGNVFVMADGRIALIDFGMVGRLTDTRRAEVVRLLFGLVERDTKRVKEVLLDWASGLEPDNGGLGDDIDAFVDRYHDVPLGQLNLAAMLLDVTVLLRVHRLSLPPDLAVLIKTCITLEGLGRSLDPGFDMARQARPFLRRALAAQYAPGQLTRRAAHVADDALRLMASAPRDLLQLLRAIRNGRANLHVEIDEMRGFSTQISHAANRLAGSMVIAALIIGSSIAMTVEGGPTLLGLPLFGLLGFLGASLAGTWLLWWILRSGGGR